MGRNPEIGVHVPMTYVYIEITHPEGATIWRFVYPHDGVRQAVDEALGACAELSQFWRIREIWVHQDAPRRFRPEPVVKRTLEAREW